MHALLYLIVSLLAVALIFFTLGAPFVAALEVIIYAGAIMVLFVFVVMMLNLGAAAVEQEKRWRRPRTWVGPAILAAILLAELVYVLFRQTGHRRVRRGADPAAGPGRDAVRPVPARRGAGVAAAAGGPGRRVSPRAAPPARTAQQREEPVDAGMRRVAARRLRWHRSRWNTVCSWPACSSSLGLTGVLVRRNIIFMLLSLEIMLNAAGLAFVVAGSRWGQPDGQVMFLFILTMAAAEVSVGLALVLQLYRGFKTLDADAASRMRG